MAIDAASLAIEESIARIMLMLRASSFQPRDRDRLRGEINGRCFALRVLNPDRYGSDVVFDDAWLDARGLLLPHDCEISDDSLLRAALKYLDGH